MFAIKNLKIKKNLNITHWKSIKKCYSLVNNESYSSENKKREIYCSVIFREI